MPQVCLNKHNTHAQTVETVPGLNHRNRVTDISDNLPHHEAFWEDIMLYWHRTPRPNHWDNRFIFNR